MNKAIYQYDTGHGMVGAAMNNLASQAQYIAQAPTTGIELASGNLAKTIDELGNAISLLAARLQPVLAPSVPGQTSPVGATEHAPVSPLRESLNEFAARLVNLRASVDALNARVEL